MDVVAPRLSRATSRAVPEAFQALFNHFSDIDGSDFSQDALVFLKSVVAAVPDLIAVKGLSVEDKVSEVSYSSRSLSHKPDQYRRKASLDSLTPGTSPRSRRQPRLKTLFRPLLKRCRTLSPSIVSPTRWTLWYH